MRRLRAEQPQSFAKARTSGHLLGALALEAGVALNVPPTAVVSDYSDATESMIEINAGILENGKRTDLKKWDRWKKEHGVAAFNAMEANPGRGAEGLNAPEVMHEFSTRFRDGVFTMAADKQWEEAQSKIKGGWLQPYKNTLITDEIEQQKSVVAIPGSSLPSFFQHCPYLADVVRAIQWMLGEHIGKETLVFQPAELTFFLGVSAASCTLWHTDSEEHEKVELKLTTLTLLSQGTTSMCIAGKEETWLEEPFDTVAFHPALYHRSGA